MKSGKFFFIAIIFALSATMFAAEPSSLHGRGSFGVFYNHLNNYGSWMQMNDGLVVWRPRVNSRWSPYTYGSWIWTDCGWYWDSSEQFGDVVYHYGRWYYDDYYGWMWVPDYEWAPAWVQWRYNDDYLGWTPLPPYASFGISIGISFTEGFNIGYSRWHFVAYHDFCRPQVGRYFVAGREKARFFDRTNESHNYGYDNGRVVNRNIPRDMFEQRSKIRLTENRINIRETEGIERSQVRGTERRIDIAVPRERQNTVDVNSLSINRADRAGTLKGDRVQMGERVRSGNTNQQNTAPQRDNQNSGVRHGAQVNTGNVNSGNVDRGNANGNTGVGRPNQNNGTAKPDVTTPNRNNNQNSGTTVTPNRNNGNKNRNSEIRQNRQNEQRENREMRKAEKEVKRESRESKREEGNRESRGHMR